MKWGAAWGRAMGCVAVSTTLSTWARAADDEPRAPLTVLGGLEIEATWEGDERGKRLRGKVVDDLGGGRAGAQLRFLDAKVRSCDRGDASGSEVTGDDVVVTDELGEFCIVTGDDPGACERIEVRSAGYETYTGRLRAHATTARPPHIVSAPLTVDLDGAAPQVVEVWSSGGTAGDVTLRARATASRRTWILGSRAAGVEELTRFELPASSWREPGRLILTATRQDGAVERESLPEPVDVRAAVSLEVVHFSTSDGTTTLELAVDSHGEPVPAGLVEVRARPGKEFTTSGAVNAGRAVAEWPEGRAPGGVSVHFAPSSIHFRAGEPLLLAPPTDRPLSVRAILEAAFLALLLGWLLRHWWGRRRRDSELPSAASSRVDVALAEPGEGRLVGRVIDTHTREPLAAAKVELVSVTATSRTHVAGTVSDERGQFDLALGEEPNLRLLVSRTTHMSSELDVRGPKLHVALTEKRRAGILALLSRVSRRGSAWFGRRPPTPAEAKTEFGRRGDTESAAWAERVEIVAYGPNPPSEAEVRALQVTSPGEHRH